MLKIRYTNQFKKDYKLIQKRGYDINKLKEVIQLLMERKVLPRKYKEHPLTGNYKRFYGMSYSTRLVTHLFGGRQYLNINIFSNRFSFRFVLKKLCNCMHSFLLVIFFVVIYCYNFFTIIISTV